MKRRASSQENGKCIVKEEEDDDDADIANGKLMEKEKESLVNETKKESLVNETEESLAAACLQLTVLCSSDFVVPASTIDHPNQSSTRIL